jgi:hypothetical protein|tara:strand:- start:285 stop:485 length:201 start_codon:yes stop_codon:yes gene_type:complete
MLGKLESKVLKQKIELPLDESIKMLKYYKKEMPWNLYNLTSKQSHCLKRILLIIEGMEIPERMVDE